MSAETASGADFETRLALVCEDAPERQGVIKAALDQIGFAMLSVRNSDEAVERLGCELVRPNAGEHPVTPADRRPDRLDDQRVAHGLTVPPTP